jgi:putative tricarboxylic transport membrane protein
LLSRDIGSSLFLIVCAALIILGSLRLPLGELQNPGPGFLPFWVGILMLVLSIALLWRSLRNREAGGTLRAVLPKNAFKILWTFLAILAYVPALSRLGFLLATIPLTVFLFRAIGETRWKISLLGGILASLVLYLVFKVWLKIQFPLGLLGI